MTNVHRIQIATVINAPVAELWEFMFGTESYPRWTRAFFEGSYYEGSWGEGSRIRFLGPSGDGMGAEIAENRLHEFISVRHLGYLINGVEDTESESVRAWAPAYENYSFVAVPDGTRLITEQDVTEESESFLRDSWSKAFELIKQHVEGNTPD